jgi:ribosome assembly protein YihI (activator of Der GTPase)
MSGPATQNIEEYRAERAVTKAMAKMVPDEHLAAVLEGLEKHPDRQTLDQQEQTFVDSFCRSLRTYMRRA